MIEYSGVLGQFVSLDWIEDSDKGSFDIRASSDPLPAEEKRLLASMKKRPEVLVSILRNEISEAVMTDENESVLRGMLKQPSIKIFREGIFTHHRNPEFNKKSFLVFLNANLKDSDSHIGGVEITPFSEMIHGLLAYELWLRLMVSAGRKDYETFFNFVFVSVCNHFEDCLVDGLDSDIQKNIAGLLNELITANKKRGTKITNELIRTSVSIDEQGSVDGSDNCFNKVGSEITAEMIKFIYSIEFASRLPTFFTDRSLKYNYF